MLVFIIPNGLAVPAFILALGFIYFVMFRSVKDDPREKEDERNWFDKNENAKIIPFTKKLNKAK